MHKEILEDLAKDCPCANDDWCFIKELIAHTGLSDRQAEQVRLVYDYKFMQSKKEGKDIGRERAFKEFVDKYATRFAEVYKEGMKRSELFPLVFEGAIIPSEEELTEYNRKTN